MKKGLGKKISVLALSALISITLAGPAWATPPDPAAHISDITNQVSAEAAIRAGIDGALQGQITGLQGQINAEETARKNKDTDLQNQINQGNIINNLQTAAITANSLAITANTIWDAKQQLEINGLEKGLSKEVTDRKAEVKRLDGRVDTEIADRKAEVKRLDGRIDTEATTRANADKALGYRIDNEAKARVIGDAILQGEIMTEAYIRDKADDKLQSNIDKEAKTRSDADKVLQGNIDKEAKTRSDADKVLQGNINKEAYSRAMADKQEAFYRWMADKREAFERWYADYQLNNKITNERNERIAADNYLDNRITTETKRLDGRIDNLSSRVDKVGALSAALTGLAPLQYDAEAPTQFAVAAGQYAGQSAFAVGIYHHTKKDVMLNAGWSFSGSENAGRIGATWRIGGPKAKAASTEATVAVTATATPAEDTSIMARTVKIINSSAE